MSVVSNTLHLTSERKSPSNSGCSRLRLSSSDTENHPEEACTKSSMDRRCCSVALAALLHCCTAVMLAIETSPRPQNLGRLCDTGWGLVHVEHVLSHSDGSAARIDATS
jgi:hypothetical protein